MDDLEVLDGSLGDASVEVQHVGLAVLVPRWGFVHQGDQFVRVAVGVADQEALQLLPRGKLRNQTTHIHRKGLEHTCLGRMETLLSFSSIPGMITVIFLGPLNPSTFVSWKEQHFNAFVSQDIRTLGCRGPRLTHVTNCCQFLPHGLTLLDERLPLWVLPSIIDSELGAKNVGPETRVLLRKASVCPNVTLTTL